jgi:hypothetical protein
MRLHLLQAVVLFHQNRRQEASKLLARADSELSLLKVDDCSLGTLMELGVYIHLWNSLLFFLLYRIFAQLLSRPLITFIVDASIYCLLLSLWSSGRVPGYRTEMYCASCEVRTEFIYVL